MGFTTTVKDLPVEVAPDAVRTGTTINKKKRVSGTVLRLQDTSGISVNGNEITTPSFSVASADVPIENYTGIIRIRGITGYDYTGQVTITQSEPNPFTLLSISKEVNF